MRLYFVTTFIVFILVSTSYAEGPRTVGTYKRHMGSADHNTSDFDHNLHHMLYLTGVGDGYAVFNKKNKVSGEVPHYCQPETKILNGNDYMGIFEKFIYNREDTKINSLSVAEGMLLALQHEFPCP